jgi:hypothetical protein
MIKSLDELPAVAVYLRRIGATAVNFKKARIEEVIDGYPKAVGWVHFSTDGSIGVEGSATPPSAAEAAAIVETFATAEFPKMVPLTSLGTLPPQVDLSDHNVFVCHDLLGNIVMIHQRYETPGGKGFIPWTYFSDGEWRCMEPEIMPFWGVPGAKEFSTLYLHEGAKAAARVKRMIDGHEDASRFPWLEDMRWGAHLGWIGGVNAVSRSDWVGLAAMGWKRVVITVDNDNDGLRAAQEITQYFQCPVYHLRFGPEFEDRFDLGDPFPASMFDGAGKYRGPAFRDRMHSADWATDRVEIAKEDGSGTRFVSVCRRTFIERHAIVTETKQVFSTDRPAHGMLYKQFNDEVRCRSHEKDTYALLIKNKEVMCESITYDPASPPGFKYEPGHVRWNQCEPPRVKPIHGDPQPFIDYINYLVPGAEDRRSLLRWLATVIGWAGTRVRYSLLAVSRKQGVGKSTLGTILKMTMGDTNVSFPSEKSVADSAFNGWALGVRAIVVNEIYSNGRSTVYDKLKPYVTDVDIEINRKNLPEIKVNNCAVIVACSNSEKALYIPDDDRRWLIPKLTDQIMPEAWWADFYSWLEGDGAGIILHWAQTFPKGELVRPGERAPASSAKTAIIAASKSEGRLHARDFAEEFAARGEKAILKVRDLRTWVASRRDIEVSHSRMESEKTLIDEVEGVPGIHVLKGDKRPKIGGRNGTKEAVILNFVPEPGQTWMAIEQYLLTDIGTAF